jgi:hypothetical protein
MRAVVLAGLLLALLGPAAPLAPGYFSLQVSK